MRVLAGAVLCMSLPLAGCHSRYVQATIVNASGNALHGVQVEYPSASFGIQDLAANQVFHYQFKVIGSGPIRMTFTDRGMQDHQQTGPTLHEGDEGQLLIRFPVQDRAEFQLSVRGR